MRNVNLPNFMYISLSGTKLSILALQIYFATSIFYVFKSGYPQPADILIFLAVGLSFIFYLFRPHWNITAPMGFGILFALCTFVINMTHYLTLPDKKFFLSSLYYLFNISIFLYTYSLYKRASKQLNKSLIMILSVAVFLECFAVFVLGIKDGSRAIGTFNNPNQLAYWTLLSFCILVVLRYPKPFNWYDYIVIGLLFLIEMESLSKAALIAFMFAFFCLSFTKSVHMFWRVILFMFALSFLAFVSFSFETIVNTFGSLDNIQNTITRLSEIGKDSDDNLEGRGYDRLIENPEYLILGAGEGGYTRFSSIPYELHSGIATLVFAYGISGTILFGLFLFSILRKLPPIYWLLLFSIMLYGLTHQNIRFTYFWVFLGLIAAIGDLRMAEKRT